VGVDDIEASIHAAMVQAIADAQHYVFIENQFFISSASPNSGSEVKNGVGAALAQRVIKAHK